MKLKLAHSGRFFPDTIGPSLSLTSDFKNVNLDVNYRRKYTRAVAIVSNEQGGSWRSTLGLNVPLTLDIIKIQVF